MFLYFEKYQGAGNDFIVIDDRQETFPASSQNFIQKLCHRQLGIGADGLLLLQRSDLADYKMRIFNADGQEAAMCGNGIRCLTHFIVQRDPLKTSVRFETKKGVVSARYHNPMISVNFGIPQHVEEATVQGYSMDVVDTGVPHAVIFVSDVNAVDVAAMGKKIRYDKKFLPDGVNVNFVQIYPDGALRVRTYERGVEGETLSCGTGLAASAYAAALKFKVSFPLSLHTAAQEVVQAHKINLEDSQFAVEVVGLAACVYQGKIYIGEQT